MPCPLNSPSPSLAKSASPIMVRGRCRLASKSRRIRVSWSSPSNCARIVQLFRLARQSVDQELGARGTMPQGSENGADGCQPRYATPAQVRAIHAIVKRLHLDLADELNRRFAVTRPEELLLEEASQLIDAIQTARNDLATGQHGGAAGQ